VNVTKCLECLFRDGKIIPSHIPTFLKDIIGIKYLMENVVDIDVDIANLREKLHRTALDCLTSLDREVIQKGKEYLVALINLCPKDCVTLYNLACAESLLNHVPDALKYLELAIKCGYNDLEHMLDDKDFDNIRNSEGFMKLVNLVNDIHSGSSFRDECEDCECNNEECKHEDKECKHDDKNNDCCGLDGCDEPVVLEYDSFGDSVQFNDDIEPPKEQKEQKVTLPNNTNNTKDTKVEQLNDKLTESFVDLRSKWLGQISSIKSLGFAVDDEVLSLLLEQTNGNVEEVVSLLLLNK